MRKTVFEKLQFTEIISILAGNAVTAGGRERCLALIPADSPDRSMTWLNQSEEAALRILRYGDLPLGGVSNIRPAILHARAGGVLECGDFLRIAAFLRAVERLISETEDKGGETTENAPNAGHLLFLARSLKPLPGFRERLEQSVASEDDLFERASETLFNIRRRLRDAQDAVRRELDKILSRKSDALRESLITIRSGRYVVPVRSDRRQSVEGLVHDTSASGNTLYVEPAAVVELNNKIREMQAAEKHEILLILKELSGIAAFNADLFLKDIDLISELDFLMAKGHLAIQQNAVKPRINDRGEIVLRKARHPLIPKEKVVPIDFELGKAFQTLVITGPNTGGKTVTLKTCGLLTLMAMSGLMIPAGERSEVAWFPKIAVDIGDEQSIEQSLSTFSSHIREIIDIAEEAGPGMLALVDELGAGTDPSEGAALAIAVLDHLKSSGAYTVATTHYQELKGYALNEPGVENACCEFDVATLRPTYRLLVGVPGVSNALAIATRLGLDPAIVGYARSLISDEGTRFENLVAAIEQSHREAKAIEAEIERLKKETEDARAALERERDALRAERENIIANAEREAEEMVEKAEEDIGQLLASIRESAAASDSGGYRLNSEVVGKLRSLKRRNRRKNLEPGIPGDQKLSAGDIVPGGLYEAKSLGVSGVARSVTEDGEKVLLESGSFKITVPCSALRPVPKSAAEADRSSEKRRKAACSDNTSSIRTAVVSRAGTELMLLGKRVDEALGMLDPFLDDAMLAGISPVRVVHGKGTGALRTAMHEALSRDRRIRTFRLGGDGEGGDGVTVAELNLKEHS